MVIVTKDITRRINDKGMELITGPVEISTWDIGSKAECAVWCVKTPLHLILECVSDLFATFLLFQTCVF